MLHAKYLSPLWLIACFCTHTFIVSTLLSNIKRYEHFADGNMGSVKTPHCTGGARRSM